MSKLEYFKRFTYIPNEVYDYLQGMEAALNQALAVAIEAQADAKPTVAATADGYLQPIGVAVVLADGRPVEFPTGTLKLTITPTATAGTVAVDDGAAGAVNTAVVVAAAPFARGAAAFDVHLGGTWAAGDTVKAKVEVTIAGKAYAKTVTIVTVQANPAE